MSVAVRRIDTVADREAIFRVRHDLYKGELGARLPADARATGQLRDPHDDHAGQYGVFAGDRIVGGLRVFELNDVGEDPLLAARYDLATVLSTFMRDEVCFAGRLALDPTHRGGRALIELMSVAYADVLAAGRRLVVADCSPRLLPLYESFGFRRYGEPFNDATYGFKIPIVLVCRDLDRLCEVRSPLALVAAGRVEDDAAGREWFATRYPQHLADRSAALLPGKAFLDLVASRLGDEPTRGVTLFRGLEPEDVLRLLRRSTLFSARAGDQVLPSGVPGDGIFVLVSGSAEVVPDHGRRPLLTLRRGDTFGEIAFLTGAVHAESVVARESCEIVAMSGEAIAKVVDSPAPAAARVAMNLARMVATRLSAA